MTLFQDPELRKHFVNIKTSWEGFLWNNCESNLELTNSNTKNTKVRKNSNTLYEAIEMASCDKVVDNSHTL
jgi:hypothetical protein